MELPWAARQGDERSVGTNHREAAHVDPPELPGAGAVRVQVACHNADRHVLLPLALARSSATTRPRSIRTTGAPSSSAGDGAGPLTPRAPDARRYARSLRRQGSTRGHSAREAPLSAPPPVRSR